MKTRKIRMTALVLAAGLSGTAQAALHDRGGGLIYDDVLHVTWLQDANYAKTSGYDADGLMTWNEAIDWTTNLVYQDSVRNVTYTDWRLPNSDTCLGYGCADSEMGHLFYTDLGQIAGQSILGSGDPDMAKFINLQQWTYWSGTEYAPDTSGAWAFDYDGYQDGDQKSVGHYALAIRDGDVAAVPEADTWAMLLVGLGLVVMAARRQHG